MIDSLAAATTLASVLLGVAVLVAVLAGRYRWRRVAGLLAGLELAVLLHAVVAVVGSADDRAPREPAVHLAYLVASVLVLPATFLQVRGDDDRWAGTLVAVACGVLAVVVVRATTTGRPA